jgi:hypothetical protein
LKRRNKFFFAVLLSLIVSVLGACSNSSEDNSSAADTEKKEMSETAPDTEKHNQVDSDKGEQTSENLDTNKNTESDKNSAEDKSDASHAASEEESPADASKSSAGNEDKQIAADSNSENTFDIKNYLDANYAIEGVHYVTDTWENKATGKVECIVNILPDTKEYSNELNEVFHSNKGLYEDERTDKLDKTANAIIRDLPEINSNLHIESVNWVSYDGEFHVTLVQDIK